jgi:hypothetical protein
VPLHDLGGEVAGVLDLLSAETFGEVFDHGLVGWRVQDDGLRVEHRQFLWRQPGVVVVSLPGRVSLGLLAGEHDHEPLFYLVVRRVGGQRFLSHSASVGADPAFKWPPSAGGKIEVLRVMIRTSGARGALFCAGVIQVMTDGTRCNAVQFHVDHVDDPCAHTITIPYLIDSEARVRHGDHLFEETDDLLLARTAD